jgi:hypothetical protein
MPFAYLMRLASTISGPSLSAQQQTTLLAELKAGLDEDGDDASARRDIKQLLTMLRDRSDVTWRTRTEVEAVLASLEPVAAPSQPVRPMQSVQSRPPAGPPPGYQPRPPMPPPPSGPPAQHPGPGKGSGSRTKWLIAGGGAAAAAVIAVVVVLVITMTGNDKPTPPPPPSPPPTVAPEALSSLLLTPDEVGSIVGVTNLEGGKIYHALSDPQGMSNPECAGAHYNGVKAIYEGSGYSTVVDQILSVDKPEHVFVEQTAVLFPGAEQAKAFFGQSADKWKSCVDQTMTITTSDGQKNNWALNNPAESESKIVQVSTQEGMGGYGCQHVMRVMSNVIVEAQACQDRVNDQAERIADRMAAKAAP